MRTRSLFVLLGFLWFAGCETAEETPVQIPGPEYFPLQTGSFILYNVDSVRIIQNVESAYNFQLRISVVDSYVNAEGNMAYVLQRDKRNNPSQPWAAAGTWTAWKSIRQAVVTEGTASYIKLQFPTSVGISWNGNALNANGGDERCNGADCDEYEVTSVDPDLIVTQSNDADILVKQDIRFEKYTKDVGLVYKELTVLEYCTSGACFGKQYIDNGLRYKQQMIESGSI